MTIFRNHNLRLLGIALLLLGFAPGLMPARANYASAEAVSIWLYGFASENTSELAWEKITQLDNLQDEPDILLKKASKMISANAELFALPVNSPEPTDEEIFNVLIQEWNRQQQTGSMGTALIPERLSQGLPFWNVNFTEAGFTEIAETQGQGKTHAFEASLLTSPRLLPLTGGISINAP